MLERTVAKEKKQKRKAAIGKTRRGERNNLKPKYTVYSLSIHSCCCDAAILSSQPNVQCFKTKLSLNSEKF